MSRSLLFRNLARAMRIDHFCEDNKISTNEGLERVAELEVQATKRRATRREFLESMGKAALVGAMGTIALPLRRTSAAPNVSIGIVGAGLAGLACADELKRNSISVTLYDASNRVGGRCFSLRNFFPGQVAERGGEFIDNLHKTMLGYAQEFNLKLEDVEKEPPGEVFYFFKGQLHPESVVIDEYRDLVAVMHDDLRTLTPPTADSYTNADEILDFTSLREYLETRGAGDIIKAAVEEAYVAEYGLEPDEQSCLNFLLFIHADRRSKFRPFGVFSDERYHVISGNDQIVNGLYNRLQEQTQLGMRLVKARKNATGQLELTFKDGSRTISVIHDVVVFAIPFSTLRDVELDSSLDLPSWKLFAINNLRYGTNAKMMVGFNSRPWIALGSKGASYSDLTNHQTTWETNPINATSTRAVLTDYSGGDRGANLNPKKVQTETMLFLQDLNLVYPGAFAAATRDAGGNFLVHLEHWPSNPLTKGSYTCNHPGYFTTIADNEAKPVGNLYFAGEHTNSFYEWQGFMEGAALSGIRAANEILKDIKVGVLG
ncbi:MAG TPA: FAD-dependent oxidoreductase [Thermodesulfobacteriota bacterium]|nr:FAD-dependent oxidoreductase [Thermodesulfobacteriota bacterium]